MKQQEPTINDGILEALAALEHEQWAAWTNHFLSQQTPENLERWERQAQTAYADLSEDEKEKDRIWARKALALMRPDSLADEGILFEGRYLRLRQRGNWEYVERRGTSGIVGIVAVTSDGKIVLVEQYRAPVGCNVIEIPAGLAGDLAGSENEPLAQAARRELLEETGYDAAHFEELTAGPVSAGLSTEIVTFFRAIGLERRGSGGGDGTENIRVHEVPLAGVHEWLEARRAEGVLVDYKVYSALHFASK